MALYLYTVRVVPTWNQMEIRGRFTDLPMARALLLSLKWQVDKNLDIDSPASVILTDEDLVDAAEAAVEPYADVPHSAFGSDEVNVPPSGVDGYKWDTDKGKITMWITKDDLNVWDVQKNGIDAMEQWMNMDDESEVEETEE